MSIDFTTATITFIVSTVLNVILVLVPVANDWWMAKTPNEQSGLNMLAGLVVALGVFGLGCAAVLVPTGFTCGTPGLMNLLAVWVAWFSGSSLSQSKAFRTRRAYSIMARHNIR